ncbi:hypothetical protein [Halobaculum sp. MBLA0143]|uniref:hypothetical protein n=1 Tax=Halobaculum sp. MBLA0143 TaxID=3079933 RepID=UPI003526300E
MRGDTLATGLLAVASLLPAVGVVAFGWGATAVAVAYSAELTTLVWSYVLVGLFAQQPNAIDERERMEVPLLPIPKLLPLPERVDLPLLPSVRTKNVHVVGVSAVFLSLITATLGAMMTDNFTDDPTGGVRNPVDIHGFLSDAATVIGDTTVTVLVAGVVLAQIAVVYRWYGLGDSELSAYVVMQRLGRIVVGYGVYGVVWYAVGVLSSVVLPVGTLPLSVVGFSLVKVELERRRVVGESETPTGGPGAWLVPVDR